MISAALRRGNKQEFPANFIILYFHDKSHIEALAVGGRHKCRAAVTMMDINRMLFHTSTFLNRNIELPDPGYYPVYIALITFIFPKTSAVNRI